jgi:hypothetical protein
MNFRSGSFSGLLSLMLVLGTVFGEEFAIKGPLEVKKGTLAVFEVPVKAVFSVAPFDVTGAWHPDSSGTAIYFASNTEGIFDITAVCVQEGEPRLAQFSFVNGSGKPSPKPEPDPVPPPPVPVTLAEWVTLNVPKDALTAKAALIYSDTAAAVKQGTVRSVDAAASKIRMAELPVLTSPEWTAFLTQLDAEMKKRFDSSTDSLEKYREILSDITEGLKAAVPQDAVPDVLHEVREEPAVQPAAPARNVINPRLQGRSR